MSSAEKDCATFVSAVEAEVRVLVSEDSRKLDIDFQALMISGVAEVGLIWL